MSKPETPHTHPAHVPVYQIRIRGELGSQWADWFNGLSITQEAEGCTLLTGPVIDQAALYGILTKFRDLGIELLTVELVQPNRKESDPSNQNQASQEITNGSEPKDNRAE